MNDVAIMETSFLTVRPFPYVVMENFLDSDTVARINSEWPDSAGWTAHNHGHSAKRGIQDWEAFGPATRDTLQRLNGAEFVEVLGVISGISGLSADDSLVGGGLHETFRDGFLGIHADFNIHPETRLFRRLNLLLYLNEGWKPEWGGALELWDREKTGCQVRIEPIAGRCVVFATSTASFHGHPEPLACPPDRSRRSIALYYYSAEPPDEETREHSTLYLGDEDHWFAR